MRQFASGDDTAFSPHNRLCPKREFGKPDNSACLFLVDKIIDFPQLFKNLDVPVQNQDEANIKAAIESLSDADANATMTVSQRVIGTDSVVVSMQMSGKVVTALMSIATQFKLDAPSATTTIREF